MSFLKLSGLLINTSKISSVKISENKYTINLISGKTHGLMLFCSGSFSSVEDSVEVNKDKHPEDYESVSKLINNLNK